MSLFSTTPGKLTKEVEQIQEGFVCGRDKEIDFVTFSVKYGCWTYKDTESGWSESEIPTLHVDNDDKGDERITRVSIDTKGSVRWVLAINTEEIEDFWLQGMVLFLQAYYFLNQYSRHNLILTRKIQCHKYTCLYLQDFSWFVVYILIFNLCLPFILRY